MQKEALEKALAVIEHTLGSDKARKVKILSQSYDPQVFDHFLVALMRDLRATGEVTFQDVQALCSRRFQPVGIEEFICSPLYLGKKDAIYPKVMEELIEINSGAYDEVVLTGSIGAAKTTIALYSISFQLYLLSSYVNPHAVFGLDSASEILFVFQSLRASAAKEVEYDRFVSLIDGSPYFKDFYPYDRSLKAQMRFPNRIIVKPISGTATAAIGENVLGGCIDEVNFMQVIQNSKQSIDGGEYNQAIALYNSIARRRKSRFMMGGRVPGLLCIISSKRYPGQFTDVKTEEAHKELEETGQTRIYVYDKKSWDVLPEGRFSGEWFHVFIGDLARKPRILADDEKVHPKDRELVLPVPIEYKKEFESDIMDALRDIGGVSTLARHPYFINTEAVAAAFGTVESVLSREEVDFKDTLLQIYPKKFRNVAQPRFCHIDLGLSGDAAGVAVGYVSGFTTIKRGEDLVEVLPTIEYDFTLRVVPPKGGEIQFHKIRSLLYKLRELGLNIKWVSLDSWQSVDMIQVLRTQGFVTGTQSVDTTTLPYDLLKSGIYDGRVKVPAHPHAQKELVALEFDPKVQKVDHPPHGGKDIGDAMAGVAMGLTMRREIWAEHGIDMVQMPQTIQQLIVRAKDSMVAAS